MGSSFLREGYSDWYAAVRQTDGKTAALRVMVVSGCPIEHCADSLSRQLERLARLDSPGVSRPVAYGVEKETDYLAQAWYALECPLPVRTLEVQARIGLDVAESLRLIACLGQALTKAHQVGLALRPEASAIMMASGRPQILLNLPCVYSGGVAAVRGWIPPPPLPRACPPQERGRY